MKRQYRANEQPFVISERPGRIDDTGRRNAVVYVTGGGIHHIGRPIGVALFGEVEIRAVLRIFVELRRADDGAGVDGGDLAVVRLMPVDAARMRAAAGRVPAFHDIGEDELGLIQIHRIVGQ